MNDYQIQHQGQPSGFVSRLIFGSRKYIFKQSLKNIAKKLSESI